MSSEINAKQINLHHCKGATSLISRQLTEMQTKKQQQQNKQIVVLAQEPWTRDNKVHGFDEKLLNVYYRRNSNIRPRALIITTKDVSAMQLP